MGTMDEFLSNLSTVIPNSTAVNNPVLVAIEASISALLNISALVGNSLVCLAIYRSPSLRTVTNIFVLSLAITDLLAAVLIMPFNTASIVTTSWITGEVGCQFNYYCVNILAGVSITTTMLVAVNRYIRVVRSTLYPKIFSKTRGTIIALGAWVLMGLLILATHFLMTNIDSGTQTFHVQYPASCYQIFTEEGPSKLFNIMNTSHTVVVSAIMVTCYVKIYQKLRHHNAAAAPSSQGGHSAYGVNEAMITKMLGIVVVGFFLCWLPGFAYNTVGMLITVEENVYENFFSFSILSVFTSSAINPLVYTVFSREFRNEFSRIIRFQGTS